MDCIKQGVQVRVADCEEHLHQLVATDAELTGQANGSPITESAVSELTDLKTFITTNILRIRKVVVVHTLYVKILHECKQLLIAATRRIQPTEVAAVDIEDLKNQVVDTKKLMGDLEVYRAVLDALRNRTDVSTVSRHAVEHKDVTDQTCILLKRATQLTLHMDRTVSHWEELEVKRPKAQEAIAELQRQNQALNTDHEDQNRLTALKVTLS